MDFNELVIGCRTYRRFLQDPVPEEVIREALECARLSNSGRNAQDLRFYAVTSPETVKAMQPLVFWAKALPKELGTPVEGEQPTAFIAIVKTAGAGSFSDVDLGIAARTITLSAYSHGFGSCMMGAINVPKISELLGVPEGDTLRLVIALGKPAHTSTIVGIPESGSKDYYLDEERNYYVPKISFDELVCFK